MGFLANKRALITGIAGTRSIAYGIAQAFAREGAQLAFTYQNDKLKSRVEKVAAEFGSDIVIPLDVADDASISALPGQLQEKWDGLDIVIHSIAYAPADQLDGDYLDVVTREGFNIAHDISSYSFAALGKALRPMMQGRSGSMLTLSYLGAERAAPNYNVMGVAKASLEANVRFMALALGKDGHRVNAISAGPIKTLAAAGIKNFRKMLDHNRKVSPLHDNVDIHDVGNVAAFLCSDLARGVTAEVIHVDAGYSKMSMTELLFEDKEVETAE